MSDNINNTKVESQLDKLVRLVAGEKLSAKNVLPKHRWVVAIDFGTAYSGYAFYMTSGTNNSIEVNTKWGYESSGRYKTDTVVLLDRNAKFVAFGEEALKEFLGFDPEEAQDYYFFKKFKMLLHRAWEDNDRKALTRRETLEAANGRSLPAVEVIAHALTFMKKNFCDNIQRSAAHTVQYDDVLWVITVPAIWNDAAKQFMREAAVDAGLVKRDDPNRLLMALEPEAAGLWCKELQVDGFVGPEAGPDIRKPGPGDSYVIIDAGGGTVDIAVHRIQPNGSVKEIHAPSGGPWGGDFINRKFEEILEEVFGDCLEQYKREDAPGYHDFLQQFEAAKRTWDYQKKKPMRIQFPSPLQGYVTESDNTVAEMLEAWVARYDYQIDFKRGYLLLHHECAKMLFESVVEDMVDHVTELLQGRNVRDVKTVFMVGGFSECNYLQDRIRTAVGGGKLTMVPQDAGLSVLKGAVQFGKNPQAVQERIAKQTYGVIIAEEFDPKRHKADKKIVLDGKYFCRDVFKPYVTARSVIRVGTYTKDIFTALNDDATEFAADIYASQAETVYYKDDRGTKNVGKVKVKLDRLPEKLEERPCVIVFSFDRTEIQAFAVDIATGNAGRAVNIDFLADTE